MVEERINFQETHDQVKYIQDTFNNAGIKIKKHSFLSKLLSNTLKNYNASNTFSEVKDALFVNRIYSALLILDGFNGKNKYLKDLQRSTLDFMDVSQSHSKDIFFELEVAGSLRKIFKDTYLDEPDIVVPFEDGNVGIACKKINSVKNIEKQLSKGVRQIKSNNYTFGIVAINIDNLLPENKIINADTSIQALDILHNRNMKFINENSSKFLKYLTKNRIISVLIVSSTIADIKNERPRFNNISQSTIWTIQDLGTKHKDKINQFRPLENI